MLVDTGARSAGKSPNLPCAKGRKNTTEGRTTRVATQELLNLGLDKQILCCNTLSPPQLDHPSLDATHRRPIKPFQRLPTGDTASGPPCRAHAPFHAGGDRRQRVPLAHRASQASAAVCRWPAPFLWNVPGIEASEVGNGRQVEVFYSAEHPTSNIELVPTLLGRVRPKSGVDSTNKCAAFGHAAGGFGQIGGAPDLGWRRRRGRPDVGVGR